MYRPLWSDKILQEVGDALESKLHLTSEQRAHRISEMSNAFPEALVQDGAAACFAESLTGIPDKDDRHVLASAIMGHAQVIVTANLKDFPSEYLAQFDILCHHPDEFLIHQFHLNQFLVLEKLAAQAVNIRQERANVIAALKPMTPKFAALVEGMI